MLHMKLFAIKLFCTLGMSLCWLQSGAQTLNEAKQLYEEEKYAEAKPAFEKFVKQSPSNSSYNLWYGVCCLKTGDLEAAEKPLAFAVKRKQIEAFRYRGDLCFLTYRMEEAVDMYEQYLEWLEKKKRDTAYAEQRLDLMEDALRMMERTEDVQIIDSMVVGKEDFLQAYTLSEESGSIAPFHAFFDETDVQTSVYMNQKKNKIYYAQPADSTYRLFTRSLLLDKWADEKRLPMNDEAGADDNYPFVMPDGVTIYYASTGNGALGGYDLFVTRYNLNSDTYLAPEQLGMPFNSPYNDYLIVFDAVKGLGWFVSDRFQPEGQVCVYLFIPNEHPVRVETDDIELKRARASVRSIRDSWRKGEADYAELIQLAHQEIPFGKPQIEKDFELVIQDDRVYYKWEDIQSSEARSIYQKAHTMKQELEGIEKKLTPQRMDYTLTNSTERKEQLAASILHMEERRNELQVQIKELEKQARNAEIRYLKLK